MCVQEPCVYLLSAASVVIGNISYWVKFILSLFDLWGSYWTLSLHQSITETRMYMAKHTTVVIISTHFSQITDIYTLMYLLSLERILKKKGNRKRKFPSKNEVCLLTHWGHQPAGWRWEGTGQPPLPGQPEDRRHQGTLGTAAYIWFKCIHEGPGST